VTLCLTLVAAAVAVVAAVRSTWSPCGLSMLSTITPFGERGRGNAYRTTTVWFVVGATVGGATTGAFAAGAAAVVRSFHPSPATLGTAALVATAVAFLSDAGVLGVRVPIHRRQVNERWLDRYRAWVYGAGFGWQIGTGLATYITSAAVYLMVVLAALTTSPPTALVLLTGFGLVRGLAVLLTRHLTGPADLLAFHRRFAASGPRAGRLVVAVEGVAVAVLAAVVRTPAAVAVLAATALAAGAGGALHRRAARGDDPTTTVPPAADPADPPTDVVPTRIPAGVPPAGDPQTVAVGPP
jgi:hypothetical protein